MLYIFLSCVIMSEIYATILMKISNLLIILGTIGSNLSTTH